MNFSLASLPQGHCTAVAPLAVDTPLMFTHRLLLSERMRATSGGAVSSERTYSRSATTSAGGRPLALPWPLSSTACSEAAWPLWKNEVTLQVPDSVGVSKPTPASGWLLPLPDESCIVPTSCRWPSRKVPPVWQVAHCAVLNTVWPRAASTLRLPSAVRAGLRMNLSSDDR